MDESNTYCTCSRFYDTLLGKVINNALNGLNSVHLLRWVVLRKLQNNYIINKF